jgi:hypothetical protein
MRTWLKIVAVVVVLALVAAAGYAVGVIHAIRVQCAAKPAAAPGTRSIPYPSTICDQCYANWPDWWCWAGGCPLP